MSASWELLFLLFAPGIFGLVMLMSWLEVYLTQREVADEVAVVWQSTDSADELERKVGLIVKRVMLDST
ncbi:MAG TPA: hypothetical protein VHE57_02530 [Mycobacteriales bacterium]|jgi:hypothetical protein|nr:hypothetical protein [Mycobacteriales bacterium]